MAGTPSSTSSDCIIDFGATHELFNDRTLFSTFRRLSTKVNGALGDGSLVPAHNSGTLTLRLSTRASIMLEALSTPKLRHSLRSISELAFTYQIVFRSKKCHLKQDLLEIYKNSEYELAAAAFKETTKGSLAAVSITPTKEHCHQGLGHLRDKAVEALLKMHSTLPGVDLNAVPDADLRRGLQPRCYQTSPNTKF